MSEEFTSTEKVHFSKIAELQYLNRDYRGWTSTNEDHLLLLEGLRGIRRSGGFFGVGEFQVLDIALQLGADAIVLGDLDKNAVRKNLEVLKIVESSDTVSEVFPKIFKQIELIDGKDELSSIKEKMTLEGTHTGARVKLAWARSEPEFIKLKTLISQGRVAVAQVDITDPNTTIKVGEYFKSRGSILDSAYLSNIISLDKFGKKSRLQHKGAADALYIAGGRNHTLLIRSGQTTNPKIKQKILEHYPSLSERRNLIQEAMEDTEERKTHYGNKFQKLPERIERVYTTSLFLYAYEYFTQELGDYRTHVNTLLER